MSPWPAPGDGASIPDEVFQKQLERVVARSPQTVFQPRSLPVSALQTGQADGELVRMLGGVAVWGTASAAVAKLTDVGDVDTVGLSGGQVLVWDAATSTWKPGTAGGGTAATTAFTPAGSIAATNVQAAVQELDAEKASLANKIHEFALPTAATPMNGYKFTDLGTGTANGDSLQYEQLFTTGTVNLLGAVSAPAGFQSTTADGIGTLGPGSVSLFRAPGDTQGAASLSAGNVAANVVPYLRFGPGGSSAADWWMRRTAANEVTLDAGDVLKLDTRPAGTNDATAATTAFVQTATGSMSANRPAVRAYAASSTQSIPHATTTAIAFGSPDVFDTDAMHDPVTNNTRITIVTPGTYVFQGTSYMAPSAAGNMRILIIRKNGSSVITNGQNKAEPHAGDQARLTTSLIDQAVAGDYYELCWFHDAGAPLTLNSHDAHFSAAWVGGTGAAWGNAGAHAWRTSALSPATATWTVVPLDAETNDTDGLHSTTTNPSRLTATTAGRYQINAGAAFAANATGYRILGVCKNAAGVYDSTKRVGIDLRPAHALDANILRASFEVDLNAGDYIELFVWQNSGAALALSVGNPEFVFLDFTRVGYQTNPSTPYAAIARGSSALTLGTAAADMPGAAITIPAGSGGMYAVDVTFDLESTVTTSALIIVGELVVNGVVQTGAAVFTPNSANGRATVTQNYLVPIAAGQIAKLRAYKTVEGGTAVANPNHTTIRVQRVSA